MNAPKADITLYHNPRCSKSREALALLRSHGVEPAVIEYLNTPPDAAELARIVALLGIEPQALVRKGEDVFKQSYAGKTLDARECRCSARRPCRCAEAISGSPSRRLRPRK